VAQSKGKIRNFWVKAVKAITSRPSPATGTFILPARQYYQLVFLSL
jgi:hypothetical protein